MSFLAIVFSGILAFTTACVIVFNAYSEFKKELATIEQNYMQSQHNTALMYLQLLRNIVEYRYQKSQGLTQEEIHALLREDIAHLTYKKEKNLLLFVQTREGKTIYSSSKNEPVHEAKEIYLTQEFTPLDLVLTSSVSGVSIEDVLAEKKREHEDKIISFVFKIYLFALFLYLISTVEYGYVKDRIGREIRFIVESFKGLSKGYRSIDMEKLKFKEFREIAHHANTMIEEIKEKNSALIHLNESLENLVHQKTEALQRSVDFTQELLEKQDRFVKNAIHEINTPLSIILMNIDLYNLKFSKNPYLVKIEAAVKVLDNIYEDLAYMVKKDRLSYTKGMVDFSRFVQERVHYFEDVAEGNKLGMACEIEPEMFVLFNEIELQRICDNNISNAIKYAHEESTLHVRLYSKEEHLIFEVKNVGEVIHHPEKLFDRYYREESAKGGFGLGLNIVKEICDANEVRIEVISQASQTLFRYFFTKG